MKITQIKIQQTTIISINHKSSQEIQEEINIKNNCSASQLYIINSTVCLKELKPVSQNIETITIKKSDIKSVGITPLQGINIKILEMSYCNLFKIPTVISNVLTKLDISHNHIQELIQIPHSKTLKFLDMRDNRLQKINSKLFNLSSLQFLHQIIPPYPLSKIKFQQQSSSEDIIDVKNLIGKDIWNWDNEKLINICEEIVQNNNNHMMSQLISYLNDNFIRMIFEIAIKKKKHHILDLLIELQVVDNLTLQQRVMLLNPSLLSRQILKMTPLEMIIKSISHQKLASKVQKFISHLKQLSISQSLFIQSEKDLINFMSYSNSHINNHQAQFLLTQLVFFSNYDFENKAIIKYLLQLDHLTLVKQLLSFTKFSEQIFCVFSYKHMIKSSLNIYKLLRKKSKLYYKQNMKNSTIWVYPEYRERKTFCIKNDLYDYDILKQYEEMQCSYIVKDFKYTLKFYNKENEISVAKKIGKQLRKSTIKSIKNNSRQMSLATLASQ